MKAVAASSTALPHDAAGVRHLDPPGPGGRPAASRAPKYRSQGSRARRDPGARLPLARGRAVAATLPDLLGGTANVRPTAILLEGDARQLPLAAESVQCVVTSPPYWGLRDYGLSPSVWGGEPGHAHEWETSSRMFGNNKPSDKSTLSDHGDDGRSPYLDAQTGRMIEQDMCSCGAWRGILGLEPTPELYVAHLVEIFREVRRVLRADGTVWLNLGDSYATGTKGDNREHAQERPRDANGFHSGSGQRWHTGTWKVDAGLKPKDLVGIPWRVAFALQADGWWLRSDIIWAKPNPMPESITDRPTKAHEYLFLLTKSARYYYDAEAIKEAALDSNTSRFAASIAHGTTRSGITVPGSVHPESPYHGLSMHRGLRGVGTTFGRDDIHGRNRRSVWTIATEPYPEAHFATFPEKLVEPCILAGTSARGACPTCGAPWGRIIESPKIPIHLRHRDGETKMDYHTRQLGGGQAIQNWRDQNPPSTSGWIPSCACPPAELVPCRVLDPFAGSGTTVAVAERLGRVGIGIELKPAYLELARRRTIQAGLL